MVFARAAEAERLAAAGVMRSMSRATEGAPAALEPLSTPTAELVEKKLTNTRLHYCGDVWRPLHRHPFHLLNATTLSLPAGKILREKHQRQKDRIHLQKVYGYQLDALPKSELPFDRTYKDADDNPFAYQPTSATQNPGTHLEGPRANQLPRRV